ncbi:p360_12L [African swine fever virus]|uniref:p360_12L n=1 Tax=African swine fever virus TaxID=10497 RepID=A0A8A1V445_ASF|nr:p360_12L [African swine fever virus]
MSYIVRTEDHHIFCNVFFYRMFYIFRVRAFTQRGGGRTIYLYGYNVLYMLIPFPYSYTALFESISPQIHTKEHVFYIILLYCGMHGLFVVAPQDIPVLHGCKVVVFVAGDPHHLFYVHMYLVLFIRLMQVKHIITTKSTCYPPRIQVCIFLVQILYGLFQVISYGYTVPVFVYYCTVRKLIIYQIGFFYYLPYLPENFYPHFYIIYFLYYRIVGKHLMAYNIVTTTFMQLYIYTNLYNFFFIQGLLGTYLSTEVPGVLRVVRYQPILVVRPPLCKQFYMVVLVFPYSLHYRRIYVYALFIACCFYVLYVMFKRVRTIMPPYVVSLYKILLVRGHALSSQHLFGQRLQGRQ